MSTSTVTVPGSVSLNTTTVQDIQDSDSWKTTTSPRITFLSFFLLFGLVGNTCLIITICHSRRFRTTAFYIFIINLTVVNLCECLLNMTILLSTSVANTWSHGEIPCRLNAFFIHLVCIETLLSLTILTTDRMVAVKYRENYEHVISLARFTLLISVSWVLSFSFSVPIAAGAVHVSTEDNINYCTISNGASVAYCAFLTIFCYISPLVTCVCFFISIVRTWYRDRFHVRALLAQNNYDENAKEEPRIRREILYSNLSATVCISWLILEGPYVATFIFKIFHNSVELDNISNETLQYAWHVDLVLLFLKLSYVLVLPTAAFAWLKELRKEFKDILLCRKNNAVIDESMKKSKIEVQRLKNSTDDENGKEATSKQKEPRVFQVPVLFATSHGVHIKKSTEKHVENMDKTSTNAGKIFGMKCDVIGSRDNLNAIGDDTSDYDSGNEMDPFSVSHPISVKQLNKCNSLTEKHRSNSQPEVRRKADDAKICNNTVGSTSAGDSGLDLRSEYNSLPRPSLTTAKEQIMSSINAVEIKAGTNESLHSEVISPKEEKSAVLDTDMLKENEREGIHLQPEMTEIVKPEGRPDITTENGSSVQIPVTESEIINTHLVINTQHEISPASSDGAFQKRKKKRRREKLDDARIANSNGCAASPNLPLRPPPRLAPIGATSINRSQYSCLQRPGSSCSNTSSVTGGNNECVQSRHSVEDGIVRHSNKAQNSFSAENDAQNYAEKHNTDIDVLTHFRTHDFTQTCRNNERPDILSLNCNVPKSSQTEVLTPSDCCVLEGLPMIDEPLKHSNIGVENPSYLIDADEKRIDEDHIEESGGDI